MRFYVAGKFGAGEESVRDIGNALKSIGHTVIYDWTLDQAEKPYLDHVEVNRPVAQRMRQAAIDCDGFILGWGDNLLGALIECGMALGDAAGRPGKKVYLVGEDFRQSIFFVLPEVSICRDLSALQQAIPSMDVS